MNAVKQMVMTEPILAIDATQLKIQGNCKIFTAFTKNHSLEFGKTSAEVHATLEQAKKERADVYFLPIDSFLGCGLGTLEQNHKVREEFFLFSQQMQALSAEYDFVIVADSYLLYKGKLTPALSAYYKGKLLGTAAPEELFHTENQMGMPPVLFLQERGMRFAVVNTSQYNLLELAPALIADLDFLLISEHTNYTLGSQENKAREISFYSRQLNTPIVYVEGYLGGSGVPHLHNAFGVCALPEGNTQTMRERLQDIHHSALTDIYVFTTKRSRNTAVATNHQPPVGFHFFHNYGSTSSGSAIVSTSSFSHEDSKPVDKDPFREHFTSLNPNFLKELFEMQVKSLVLRLHNTGMKKIILPVSGGLDSTLAFLVGKKALEILNYPKENLIAVTMPGLGTTGTSYNNALELIKKGRALFMEIDIKGAVLAHFKDIGHDPKVTDITYENAQARERTQVALDLANKYGALFVGTGDLSEDALGWCTFGGDHLANFNVNVCLTKTMVRQMVDFLANTPDFGELKDTLLAILKAPVSPELLPSKGEVTDQKTEEILGDYIFHDFILFYYIYHHLSFEEIYLYLKKAFGEDYPEEQLKHTILTFARRFLISQFKRSCQPDATDLTDINLSPTAFHFSSDLEIRQFIELLKQGLEEL